jgi:Tol biopolymer transport system component/DNA-binding winged helix-turn-helix (wHTH) protein
MQVDQSPHIAKFGVFELDLRTRELHKNGLKIHLPHQSIQILALLLEQPGELVTREEIQARLWPDDTTVEFDHGINAAVKRLRQALGDSADNPRYVETLARRGYRFIAPAAGGGVAPGFSPADPDADAQNSGACAQGVRAVLQPSPLGNRHLRLVGIVVTLLAGAAVGWFLLQGIAVTYRQPKISNSTPITTDGKPKVRIITDGSRLYFSAGVPPLAYQIPVSGGEVALVDPLPIPGEGALGSDTVLLDISPDGSQFLVKTQSMQAVNPIWVAPAMGGVPRRVGNVVAFDAAWMPDGEHIIYSNLDAICVTGRHGSGTRKLLTVSGLSHYFRWSPDGKRLRFTLAGPTYLSESRLWEVSADGSNPHPLLLGWNNSTDECCGVWTPDGGYFVFQARTPEGRVDLWAVCEKRRLFRNYRQGPIQLSAGPLSLDEHLFSRDGKKLFAIGRRRRVELVRYDSESRQFVSYLGGASIDGVSFSRDGQWLTYGSVPEATLWRSRVDGSQRLQLTFPPLRAFNPRWSPDSKSIAFQAITSGQPWRIYVISADGGDLQQVTTGPRNDVDPSWSPDGRSIMFAGNSANFDTAPTNITIKTIELATGKVSLLPGSNGLQSHVWSPSGRYVSAVTTDWRKLMLFDFKTQKWTPLAQGSFFWHYWSKDERHHYFMNAQTNTIERVRISDRKIERLVSLSDVGRLGSGSLGAPWFGLTPNDSPLTLRDAGTTDIYALDWRAP